MNRFTHAEMLDSLTFWRREGIPFDARKFHRLFPSIFFKGAFIFQDGSIWVGR